MAVDRGDRCRPARSRPSVGRAGPASIASTQRAQLRGSSPFLPSARSATTWAVVWELAIACDVLVEALLARTRPATSDLADGDQLRAVDQVLGPQLLDLVGLRARGRRRSRSPCPSAGGLPPGSVHGTWRPGGPCRAGGRSSPRACQRPHEASATIGTITARIAGQRPAQPCRAPSSGHRQRPGHRRGGDQRPGPATESASAGRGPCGCGRSPRGPGRSARRRSGRRCGRRSRSRRMPNVNSRLITIRPPIGLRPAAPSRAGARARSIAPIRPKIAPEAPAVAALRREQQGAEAAGQRGDEVDERRSGRWPA